MMQILAIDPLLTGELLWTPLLIVLLKVVVVFVVGLLATMLMVWFERKVIAGMQNRIGPNKAGPFGILQTLADGIKLFFKEDLIPERSDRFVFKLAPYLAFVPAFLTFAIIPLGGDFRGQRWSRDVVRTSDTCATCRSTNRYLVRTSYFIDRNLRNHVGRLVEWLKVSAAWFCSCICADGELRSSLRLVSGSGRAGHRNVVNERNRCQTKHTWRLERHCHRNYSILYFHGCRNGRTQQATFDLVEAEQELVGGFNTEYASLRFALFYLAEFMNTVTMSALIVTLFFGGPQPISVGSTTIDIPIIGNALEGTVWLLLKVLVFLYIYVWFRATLPRFRYDQLMNLGWKVLIPASLGWFILLAAQRVGQSAGWDRYVVTIATALVLLVSYSLLMLAQRTSTNERKRDGVMF